MAIDCAQLSHTGSKISLLAAGLVDLSPEFGPAAGRLSAILRGSAFALDGGRHIFSLRFQRSLRVFRGARTPACRVGIPADAWRGFSRHPPCVDTSVDAARTSACATSRRYETRFKVSRRGDTYSSLRWAF